MKVCVRTHVAAIAALGAVVPLLSSLPAAAADRPLLGQFLAVPAGNTSNAYDVSEEGTVAGSVTADAGAPQPALWRGQRLTWLPLPEGTAPPPALGYAAKVEGGVAVRSAGSGQFPGFMPVVLTWRRGTPRIFTASGTTSSSTDLNRAGDALITAGGPFTSSSQVERADGTVYQPGIAAYALDGRGRTVGARVTLNGTNTVEDAARSDDTTVTIQTEATDLNTAGVVVGNAYTLTSEGQRTGQRDALAYGPDAADLTGTQGRVSGRSHRYGSPFPRPIELPCAAVAGAATDERARLTTEPRLLAEGVAEVWSSAPRREDHGDAVAVAHSGADWNAWRTAVPALVRSVRSSSRKAVTAADAVATADAMPGTAAASAAASVAAVT